MEDVILVDDQDNAIGVMEKMEAHQKGVLHRAFSILIFNSKGEMLLQKRAKGKYHSGNLWTNACCSHPLPDETMAEATNRKLKQEMGMDLYPEYAFKFIYKAHLDNNLAEHELDHVFITTSDVPPDINGEEVADWKYMTVPSLKKDIQSNPDAYTVWFKMIMNHPEFNSILVG